MKFLPRLFAVDSKQQQSRNRWPYLLIAIATLMIMSMMVVNYLTSMRMATLYPPLVDTTMEAKLEVTMAHLMFEESMSGADGDIQVVWASLDRADALLVTILEGGEVAGREVKYIDHPEVHAEIKEAQSMLLEFRRVTQQRYSIQFVGGIDSDLEIRSDQDFASYIAQMDIAEDLLLVAMDDDTQGFQIRQLSMIVIIALAVLFIGGLFVKFERGTARQQARLRANRDELNASQAALRTSKAHLEKTVADYMLYVQHVADGDLTERLHLNGNGSKHREDSEEDLFQLGMNLNDMVGSLGHMALQVRESAGAVFSAAAEIQAATTQQISTTHEQNAAVTQTATTVEEVRQTVGQTAERAQLVANVAQESVGVSREGERAVADTIESMQLIQQRVDGIAETILLLSERTQQIGDIIDAVTALAEQSKLLALNASIEAARAGEEGRGFSVVAMEVRQLAEQSKDATGRIQGILNEIQTATNSAVMATEEGSKGVASGMDMAYRAGESIRELALTIEQAAQEATEIASSTRQQTTGVDQLATAMNQIRQASLQTASSMKQIEQQVHDLSDMSRELNVAAERYQLA